MVPFDTLLIDSDILLYRVCYACEKEVRWDDDIITLHTDANELVSSIDRAVETLRANLGASEVIMCLTHPVNFRKDIYPAYKGNRGARKPLGFKVAREYIMDTFKTYERHGLEADDCLGILGTLPGACGTPCIVSDDKDLNQIPGYHANMDGSSVWEVDQEDGQRFFWTQCLTGDQTDNYPGCPGVGPKTAEKILGDYSDPWGKIVAAYVKKGLSEGDALVTARLARILTHDDYDFTNKQPKLWRPA